MTPSLSNADVAGKDRYDGAQRKAVRIWTTALIVLCVGALWLEFRNIAGTLPYPQNVDEPAISRAALRTLTTGTLRPGSWNYPPLAKYLAAAGMAVGLVRDAAHLETREIQRVGKIGYPYYETRRVIQTARQLFAFLSITALAATGLSAWFAFRQPATILLAPLFLFASPLFFYQSWAYLNVDIIGACFVTLAIAACLHGMRNRSMFGLAIAPGLLAGLATGSKYTQALVILPITVAIGLFTEPGRKAHAIVVAIAAMLVAFLLVAPCLVDIPGFLNGIAAEAFHYAKGHRGAEADPGLPQLVFYARHFASEFGVGAILSLLGVFIYARADWRRAAVLAIFPVGVLWLLISQRVHFTRNVLSLHPVVAMFAAFGLVSLYRWVLEFAARREWGRQAGRRSVRAAVGLVLAVATVPLWHVAANLGDRRDSRNLVTAWIEEHLPPGWTVVVPKQLGFDVRGLKAHGRRVVVVDLQSVRDAEALQALLSGVPSPAVIMAPQWGADTRFPRQELAAVLNDLCRHWQVMKKFGTNEVLVNYFYPNPLGDPKFAIAALP